MSGRLTMRSWVASAVCAGALPFGTAAHAAETISEEAKAYFKNGVELIQEQPPNYQDAYYQFRLAYEKKVDADQARPRRAFCRSRRVSHVRPHGQG